MAPVVNQWAKLKTNAMAEVMMTELFSVSNGKPLLGKNHSWLADLCWIFFNAVWIFSNNMLLDLKGCINYKQVVLLILGDKAWL